jgi:hypothetical protein
MRRVRDRHADHPIQGEAGCGRCLQRKLAEARRSWAENLNLSLTTTINELLIDSLFCSGEHAGLERTKTVADGAAVPFCVRTTRPAAQIEQPSTHRPWGRWEGRGARLSGRAAARPSDKEEAWTTSQISASARSSFLWKANTIKPAISSKAPAKIRPIAILACLQSCNLNRHALRARSLDKRLKLVRKVCEPIDGSPSSKLW